MINKCKHNGSIIPFISVERVKTYNQQKIANSFGRYYSDMGELIAANIRPGRYTVYDYIDKIPHTINSVVATPTNQREVDKLIRKLPSKMSSGYDNINNVLLKQLNECISFPLTLIFNQSIQTGVFPDAMKIAKIIPL